MIENQNNIISFALLINLMLIACNSGYKTEYFTESYWVVEEYQSSNPYSLETDFLRFYDKNNGNKCEFPFDKKRFDNFGKWSLRKGKMDEQIIEITGMSKEFNGVYYIENEGENSIIMEGDSVTLFLTRMLPVSIFK